MPTAPATTAPTLTTSGALIGLATRTRQPMTGSVTRASTFHSAVAISEVEMARREKPQVRHIIQDSASPTAAPRGRMLATIEVTALIFSAWTCPSPGSEPISTHV